jgi:uroporphyrinogen decarboxylase
MPAKPSTKTFLRALAGESVTPSPIWLMRQAGRYLPEYRDIRTRSSGFLDFCYSPDLAVEATLQPIRRFSFDASILFSDILVVPDALGQDVAFREGEGPVLTPLESAADISRLERAGLIDHLAPVYETVERLRRELPTPVALIGFAGAPWTLATYMIEGRGGRDFGKVRRWADTGESFAALIDLLVDAVTDHLTAQINHGAEAVQLFDSWAGVLSESQFWRWVIEPTKEIVRRLGEACPGVPVIGFPRGAGALYADFVRETGVAAVSLDSGVPLSWAAEVLQPICTVQGNLDNLALIAGGDLMVSEVRRILDVLSAGPFVFNLGHGVLPDTPAQHVADLVALVRGGSS